MACKKFAVMTLPDIEMYAGDTIPWVVTVLNEDGEYYSSTIAKSATYTLSVSQIDRSTLGNTASLLKPYFTKTGIVTYDTDTGATTVTFNFSSSDTISMSGQYLYQITVTYDDEMRSCQGKLSVTRNNNIS